MILIIITITIIVYIVNPLSANPEKWPNTLKQIVGKLPTICLSVFGHFMNLQFDRLQRAYFWYFYLLSCRYQWHAKRIKAWRDIQNI